MWRARHPPPSFAAAAAVDGARRCRLLLLLLVRDAHRRRCRRRRRRRRKSRVSKDASVRVLIIATIADRRRYASNESRLGTNTANVTQLADARNSKWITCRSNGAL